RSARPGRRRRPLAGARFAAPRVSVWRCRRGPAAGGQCARAVWSGGVRTGAVESSIGYRWYDDLIDATLRFPQPEAQAVWVVASFQPLALAARRESTRPSAGFDKGKPGVSRGRKATGLDT